MMVVPVPEEGVHRRWELMSGGTMGVKTFRFMQKDINEGRIFYKHQGLHQEDDDFFTFEVTSQILDVFKILYTENVTCCLSDLC